MASNGTYRGACIELFARLWRELDGVLAADAATAAIRLEIVRIELLLAIAACDRVRRCSLPDRTRWMAVHGILTDVLAALGRAADDAVPAAIAWSQDHLLDAVLAECPDGDVDARDEPALRTAS
jgi:hypothetical protein